MMKASRETCIAVIVAGLLLAAPVAARSLIYVTNRGGTTVQVIDSSTNKVVQTIKGIEVPQSVHFSPDGKRVYVSNGGEYRVDVLDQKTGKVIGLIPLPGHAGYVDDIAVTPDGKRLLVCIRDTPGELDIVDTTSLKITNRVPFRKGLHDIEVSDDGKYAVVGSVEGHFLGVVDLQTEKIAWQLDFDAGVMPISIEAGPGGSPRRIFFQLENLHGFAVADFATHEVSKFTLPETPSGFTGTGAPAHGIRIAPDQKTVWVTSKPANAVFVYSLPEIKFLGYVSMPAIKVSGNRTVAGQPDWLTFTPDSKTVYVSNCKLKSVSAVDVKSMKLIATVPVGEVPEKISTLELR